MALDYLPIPLSYVTEGGPEMRQFTEELPPCMLLDDYERFSYFQRYIRKLKLRIQRIYRHEIRLSGKPFDSFYLKVITDFTIVEQPSEYEHPFFVYCILELCEK